MIEKIKELRYVYETEPVDQWFGWIPLATMNNGILQYYDFGIKKEELCAFFRNDQYVDLEKVDFEELKVFSQRFLYKIGAVKDFIEVESEAKYNSNEMTDEGWLYYSAIPKDSYYCPHVILAYKIRNNGATFIGTPFRLPWVEKIICSPIRDIETEENEFIDKLNNEVDRSNVERVKLEIYKTIQIIEQDQLREDNNIEFVAGLHRLSDISHVLKKYKPDFTYDSKWEQIYFRDFEGQKITDKEIEELKIYLQDIKPIIDKCYNNMVEVYR